MQTRPRFLSDSGERECLLTPANLANQPTFF